MTASSTLVSVSLADAESPSGLALMTYQYLVQTLDQEPERRRDAAGLRGRLALEATDAGVAITLVFEGDHIKVQDGIATPVDGYIGAPFMLLLHLLSGEQNPYLAVVRRQLRVRPSPRRPLFPYRVFRLLKASRPADQAGASAAGRKPWVRRWRVLSFVGASGALVVIVVVVALKLS
jgi:putative sterol carrier protein